MPPEGVSFWQAGSYRLPEEGSPGYLEAVPGAPWRRASPTGYYKPAGKTRELKAGPHLDFLRLKGLMESDREAFDEELISFANKYGLLGLFHKNYSPPILPARKLWVAPEAVIADDGELRHVDPATEGTDLLLDLLDEQGYFDMEGSPYGSRREKREAARATKVAMPSEVTFLRKSSRGSWRGDPTGYELGTAPLVWEEAKDSCGGLLVLTEDTSSRVGVLSTREHTDLSGWRTVLLDFPSEDFRLDSKVLRAALNSRLSGVSPYSQEKEEEMDRGWRCSSLLEAMYLMLWLDMTGGRSVVKCRARGCPNWFRQGSQPDSIYCPHPDDPSMPSPCAIRQVKRESRRRRAEAAPAGA
jgi:hypothetical protein